MGFEATAHVVRGGNRTVKVSVPVVSRGPDGQVIYEGVATALFTIGAGSPVPKFEISVCVTTEEVANA